MTITLMRKVLPVAIGIVLHYQNKKLKTALKYVDYTAPVVSLKKEAMNGARKVC